MSQKERDVEKYTTTLGETIEIVGLSAFEIDEVAKSVVMPTVPTRTVETAVPGFSETQELTEESLEDDDERLAWAEYVKARDEATVKRNRLTSNFVLLEGTRFEMSGLEAWKTKRQRWSLPIPDDELELRILYYQTAIIGGPTDLQEITQKVMRRVGVDEATLKQVSSTFQRPLRGETADGTARAEGQVELQPALPGDEGGEGVERAAAEPVL